jgi:nitrogenase molybdenum-iron protein beta chain
MNSIQFGAGYLGTEYCSGHSAPSSGITETEIVFGGNERLKEQIESTLKLIDGKLYIVTTGCMTEMIGDDAEGAVAEFAEEGHPIIAIKTPSFRGDSDIGHQILLEGLFNKWVKKQGETDPRLVNVFGILPGYDPFFRGDLEEIERLGAKLGLKVNTFFSPTQTFDNILSAPNAALNIVFSRAWCHEFAKNFEEKHGTPFWVTDLPIGPEATDNFILGLSSKLKLDKNVAEKVIKEENEHYYRYFSRTADNYSDGDMRHYGVTVTNSNYALPLNKYLYNELGWVPADAFVTDKLSEEQKSAVLEGFAEFPIKPQFEGGAKDIAQAIFHNHEENRGDRKSTRLNSSHI